MSTWRSSQLSYGSSAGGKIVRSAVEINSRITDSPTFLKSARNIRIFRPFAWLRLTCDCSVSFHPASCEKPFPLSGSVLFSQASGAGPLLFSTCWRRIRGGHRLVQLDEHDFLDTLPLQRPTFGCRRCGSREIGPHGVGRVLCGQTSAKFVVNSRIFINLHLPVQNRDRRATPPVFQP